MTTIYHGPKEALQAEVGLLPCYSEKYQIVAFLDDGSMVTPEGARTKGELKALIQEYRGAYPGATFCGLV